MYIFAELWKHRFISLISFIIMVSVWFLLQYAFTPADLISRSMGSIISVLQNPDKLATESAALIGHTSDLIDAISYILFLAVELVVFSAGLTMLFLSQLKKQIAQYDKGIAEFNDKIVEFSDRLHSYETRGSAIIPYNDDPKKSFFHANILKFHDSDKYDREEKDDMSVDILIQDQYQNLLLSPSYLKYLFRRVTISNHAIKVIVVSFVDEALLAYLAITYHIGYDVRIIDGGVYQNCIKHFTEQNNANVLETRAIMCGNPFFTKKVKSDGVQYTGKYEQQRVGGFGEKSISNELVSVFLNEVEEKIYPLAETITDGDIVEERVTAILNNQISISDQWS